VRDKKMNDLCTWCTVDEVVDEVGTDTAATTTLYGLRLSISASRGQLVECPDRTTDRAPGISSVRK